MISAREKIHTPNPFYLISSSLQKLQISCQAGRLAGNIKHSFHTKINDLFQCFRMHTVSWWIQYDQIRYFTQIIDYFQHISSPEGTVIESI